MFNTKLKTSIVNIQKFIFLVVVVIYVTVLSLLEMYSGGNVRRPQCRPFSPGILGTSDLILIYYWGRLRSVAPTGGSPCSTVL